MLRDALGSYPPPAKQSVVHDLWKKHMRPWRPGSGSLISDLSEPELRKAIGWVERMFRSVEGDAYFEEAERPTDGNG